MDNFSLIHLKSKLVSARWVASSMGSLALLVYHQHNRCFYIVCLFVLPYLFVLFVVLENKILISKVDHFSQPADWRSVLWEYASSIQRTDTQLIEYALSVCRGLSLLTDLTQVLYQFFFFFCAPIHVLRFDIFKNDLYIFFYTSTILSGFQTHIDLRRSE